MENLKTYIKKYLEKWEASNDQMLIDFTKEYMEPTFFRRGWSIERKYKKQASFFRVIRSMRSKWQIIETRRVEHSNDKYSVWTSSTIFYKLPEWK